MIILLFVLLFVLLFLGVPVAVSLGLSSIIVLLLDGFNWTTLPQKVFEGLSVYSLLAIPFFILSGNLMSSGGIARRLLNFVSLFVKGIRGGVGMATIMTTMLFSTVSGSSSATTAAIGTIMIPNLEKKGYKRSFGAALCAAAGELGAIIPPSIVIIVYAMASGTSIGDMFIAAIIPGIMVGIALMVVNYLYVKRHNIDMKESINFKQWSKDLLVASKDAIWALLMPILILGGIYFGWFSPTEVSVVAVIYSLILAMFVYKEVKIKDLPKIFYTSAISTAIIMIIIGFATLFAYVLTINQVPHKIANFMLGITDNPIVFLILLNVLLLLAGMFLEAFSAIIILTPIIVPIAIQYGLDPVHLGVIVIINLAIGMITPPVGINLFIMSEIAKVRFDQLIKSALLMIAILIVNVLIITYIPTLPTIFMI